MPRFPLFQHTDGECGAIAGYGVEVSGRNETVCAAFKPGGRVAGGMGGREWQEGDREGLGQVAPNGSWKSVLVTPEFRKEWDPTA